MAMVPGGQDGLGYNWATGYIPPPTPRMSQRDQIMAQFPTAQYQPPQQQSAPPAGAGSYSAGIEHFLGMGSSGIQQQPSPAAVQVATQNQPAQPQTPSGPGPDQVMHGPDQAPPTWPGAGVQQTPGGPWTPAGPAGGAAPGAAPAWLDLVNQAWDKQAQIAGDQFGRVFQGTMGGRGILPSDATSQDAWGIGMAPIQQQLAAGRAGDISAHYGQEQQQAEQRRQFDADLAMRQAQQQQQQTWQQRQADEDAKRWAAEQAFRNSQTSYQQGQDTFSRQYQQQQLDMQRQQQEWQRQQQQAQNIAGGITNAGGTPIPPQGATPARGSTPTLGTQLASNLGVAPSPMDMVAAANAASWANYKPPEPAGGTTFSGSPAAPSWGGGTSSGGSSSSFGTSTPGWNSGAGRTGGTAPSTLYQPQGGSYQPQGGSYQPPSSSSAATAVQNAIRGVR